MNVKEQLLDIYVLGMKQKESKLPVLEKYVINGKKKVCQRIYILHI